MEIPPIKLWIYEFALIKAYIEPTHSTLDKISELLKSKVKNINKIIDINGWINNKDRKILSQALKNQEVEEFIKVSKANGVININTFTIMYLREYDSIKLIKLTEQRLFKRPSKEKILYVLESIEIVEFNFSINVEKLICSSNIKSPTSLIAAVIKELKYIKNSQIK